jgi:hypothetical protein
MPRSPAPPPPPAPTYDRHYEDAGREGYARSDRLAGLSNRYTIEFGEWFNQGTAHYSSVFGPMIGYMLLMFGINVAVGWIPVLNVIKVLFVDCALNAGFALVALHQLKGKPWTFGHFFGGFQHYGALLGNYWLRILAVVLAAMPAALIMGIGVATKHPAGIIPAVMVTLVYLGAVLYVGLRAFIFSTLLILDRGCGPVEAIQGSWTMSQGHFWGLFGTWLVVAILSASGVLLCVVGVLFTAPLAPLILTAGYLLITGTQPYPPVASKPQQPDYDDAYQAPPGYGR